MSFATFTILFLIFLIVVLIAFTVRDLNLKALPNSQVFRAVLNYTTAENEAQANFTREGFWQFVKDVELNFYPVNTFFFDDGSFRVWEVEKIIHGSNSKRGRIVIKRVLITRDEMADAAEDLLSHGWELNKHVSEIIP